MSKFRLPKLLYIGLQLVVQTSETPNDITSSQAYTDLPIQNNYMLQRRKLQLKMDFAYSKSCRNVGIWTAVCFVLLSVPFFFRVSKRFPQESLSLPPQSESKQTEIQTSPTLTDNGTQHFDKDGEESIMFGIPKPGMDYVIIYNAVPKCGSRSLLYSLSRLKKQRDIEVDTAKNAQNIFDLKEYVPTMKTPGFISGQLPFQSFNRTDVIYINMVRNPLDRLVSLYYFDIYGDKGGEHNERFLNNTRDGPINPLETLAKQKGFVNRQTFLHSFADSYTPNDGESWETIVSQAKRNIREYFIFVGITEEYEASIRLLEKLLPDYMRGLLKAYHETMTEHREKFATVNKTAPSTKTLSLLMENDLYLKHEFEIYKFVKQTFEEIKQIYL